MKDIINTLGQIEARLLQVQRIKGLATQAYLELNDLRTRALMTLARPMPGDAELGLLDGLNLETMEWEQAIVTAKAAPAKKGDAK